MKCNSLRDEVWKRPTTCLNFGTTDLKRIQTPQNLFRDFGADITFTTRWSADRVQVWVHVRGPADPVANTPGGYSKRQSKLLSKVLTAKSMAELLRPRAGTAGRVGRRRATARFQLGSSRCGLRQARFKKTCSHYGDTDLIRECKFLAVTTDFFFSHVKWNFRWISREYVTDQSGDHCFAQSFDHSLVSETT